MTKAFLILSLVIGMVPAFAADEVPSTTTRQYPGGADEQELKVQPELKAPSAKIDRRTLDQKVLQNFLRKTGQSTPSKAKPKQ